MFRQRHWKKERDIYAQNVIRQTNRNVDGRVLVLYRLRRRYWIQHVGVDTRHGKKREYLQQKLVKESEKQGLNIKCKKTKCMVINKMMNAKCKLPFGDTKINQAHKMNHLGFILTEDGICETALGKRIRIGKEASQKLHRVLRDTKYFVRKKEKYSDMLGDIRTPRWQQMLDNFFKDVKET